MNPAANRPDGADAYVDPAALRAAATGLDNRLKAALIGVLVLIATLYPPLLELAVSRFGRDAVATGLALLAGVSTLASLRRLGGPILVLVRAAVALLAASSALGAGLTPLLLVPACIYAALAWVFLGSLRSGTSLVELAARMIQPVAPDFIGPYCRRVTALWGAVLAINALVLSALALAAPIETWRFAAGVGLWTFMGVIGAAEFLVRKIYFRNYYYRGPLERVLEKLFPAEATPMGRRSAAYIRLVREKLEEERKGR
jgi:uncharacterized membrane protein